MKTVLWSIAGLLVALALLVADIWLAYSGKSPYRAWGMMGGQHMMDGFGMMGGFGMMLFWGLIIGVAVWLIVVLSNRSGQTQIQAPPSEAAIDILKRRYAAGEINKEQFDEIKASLV